MPPTKKTQSPAPLKNTSDLLTYDQAAKKLAVPKGTLYAWVHMRIIPHVRYTKRSVRFSAESLEKFIEARAVTAVGEHYAGKRR